MPDAGARGQPGASLRSAPRGPSLGFPHPRAGLRRHADAGHGRLTRRARLRAHLNGCCTRPQPGLHPGAARWRRRVRPGGCLRSGGAAGHPQGGRGTRGAAQGVLGARLDSLRSVRRLRPGPVPGRSARARLRPLLVPEPRPVPDRVGADRKSFRSCALLWQRRRVARDRWSPAALERAARAVAEWAMRAEPPAWDPETQGQWAGAIAMLGGEEKQRRITQELENARRGFWRQRVYDLGDARRHPPAVVERALRLLGALRPRARPGDGRPRAGKAYRRGRRLERERQRLGRERELPRHPPGLVGCALRRRATRRRRRNGVRDGRADAAKPGKEAEMMALMGAEAANGAPSFTGATATPTSSGWRSSSRARRPTSPTPRARRCTSGTSSTASCSPPSPEWHGPREMSTPASESRGRNRAADEIAAPMSGRRRCRHRLLDRVQQSLRTPPTVRVTGTTP